MPSPSVAATQIVSISTALVAAGGIATLSLFDIPELQSQPASRSLPSIQWLFSRGSHIFPQAAALSSAGFAYLAYNALPASSRPVLERMQHGDVPGYLAAAVLTISIAPWTTGVMVPTNFRIMEINQDKGGARSQKSREVADSIPDKDAAGQFSDLSAPQEKTPQGMSQSEEEEVQSLLDKFNKLNAVRAVLMAVGGVVGLYTALA